LAFPQIQQRSARTKIASRSSTAENPVVASAELDAFYNPIGGGATAGKPAEVIAIIQWHWLLHAGLMFAALLAIRPGRTESAIVGSLAFVLMLAVTGVLPAIALAGAFTAYVLIALLFPLRRRPASRVAG
jgi:hypothetical protein